jgi:hypothetical protein
VFSALAALVLFDCPDYIREREKCQDDVAGALAGRPIENSIEGVLQLPWLPKRI